MAKISVSNIIRFRSLKHFFSTAIDEGIETKQVLRIYDTPQTGQPSDGHGGCHRETTLPISLSNQFVPEKLCPKHYFQ